MSAIISSSGSVAGAGSGQTGPCSVDSVARGWVAGTLYEIPIDAHQAVSFDISGGGGASGSADNNSVGVPGTGGAGTAMVGVIAAQSQAYTLKVAFGGGGGNTDRHSGYSPAAGSPKSGRGADGPKNAGAAGAGGGATHLWSDDQGVNIDIVAPGGGCGGGVGLKTTQMTGGTNANGGNGGALTGTVLQNQALAGAAGIIGSGARPGLAGSGGTYNGTTASGGAAGAISGGTAPTGPDAGAVGSTTTGGDGGIGGNPNPAFWVNGGITYWQDFDGGGGGGGYWGAGGAEGGNGSGTSSGASGGGSGSAYSSISLTAQSDGTYGKAGTAGTSSGSGRDGTDGYRGRVHLWVD